MYWNRVRYWDSFRSNPEWTNEDLENLQRMLLSDPPMTIAQIAAQTGRSATAIQRAIVTHGLKKRSRVEVARAGYKSRSRAWTEDELQRLRSRDVSMPYSELAKQFPGRTPTQIINAVFRYKLQPTQPANWTSSEIRQLYEFWKIYDQGQLMQMFPGRSWGAIARKAYDIGLPTRMHQGYSSITSLSEKLGYDRETLARILEKYNVDPQDTYDPRSVVRRKGAMPKRKMYDTSQATAAVNLYNYDWQLPKAAIEIGVHEQTLRKKMKILGYILRTKTGLPFNADPSFWIAIAKGSPMITKGQALEMISIEQSRNITNWMRDQLNRAISFANIPLNENGEFPQFILQDMQSILDKRMQLSAKKFISLFSKESDVSEEWDVSEESGDDS